jgi:hypothetical protein
LNPVNLNETSDDLVSAFSPYCSLRYGKTERNIRKLFRVSDNNSTSATDKKMKHTFNKHGSFLILGDIQVKKLDYLEVLLKRKPIASTSMIDCEEKIKSIPKYTYTKNFLPRDLKYLVISSGILSSSKRESVVNAIKDTLPLCNSIVRLYLVSKGASTESLFKVFSESITKMNGLNSLIINDAAFDDEDAKKLKILNRINPITYLVFIQDSLTNKGLNQLSIMMSESKKYFHSVDFTYMANDLTKLAKGLSKITNTAIENDSCRLRIWEMQSKDDLNKFKIMDDRFLTNLERKFDNSLERASL